MSERKTIVRSSRYIEQWKKTSRNNGQRRQVRPGLACSSAAASAAIRNHTAPPRLPTPLMICSCVQLRGKGCIQTAISGAAAAVAARQELHQRACVPAAATAAALVACIKQSCCAVCAVWCTHSAPEAGGVCGCAANEEARAAVEIPEGCARGGKEKAWKVVGREQRRRGHLLSSPASARGSAAACPPCHMPTCMPADAAQVLRARGHQAPPPAAGRLHSKHDGAHCGRTRAGRQAAGVAVVVSGAAATRSAGSQAAQGRRRSASAWVWEPIRRAPPCTLHPLGAASCRTGAHL